MNKLPLSSLRVFEAAARLVPFRAAASELSLTPGAVSHALKDLEQRLGVPLFIRAGRRVTTTPAGDMLLHHVARAFSDLQRGLESVCVAGPQSLRLHCAPSFAGQWLMPRLSRFFADNPGLDLRLSADPHYPAFPSDLFDANIVYGEPRQPGLTVIPLGTEEITPLCAPSMLSRITAPTDLRALILIESEHNRLRWPHWFEANGTTSPTPKGPRLDRSSLSLAAAADGIGVALESVRLAERELREGRLIQPLSGRSNRHRLARTPDQVGFVWRAAAPIGTGMAGFGPLNVAGHAMGRCAVQPVVQSGSRWSQSAGLAPIMAVGIVPLPLARPIQSGEAPMFS